MKRIKRSTKKRKQKGGVERRRKGRAHHDEKKQEASDKRDGEAQVRGSAGACDIYTEATEKPCFGNLRFWICDADLRFFRVYRLPDPTRLK